MKIFNGKDVLEAALDRIRFLFEEFPNVAVGFSGGKDSTVILHLALQVAREIGRLPVKVMWIDQEAEWQGTVDFCEHVMNRPDVEPYWFQMPMVITNNASAYNRYSYCWDEKCPDKWIHPKHPLSIKENKYGTERFHELFPAIFAKEFPGLKSCYLAGVRTEESPKRFVGLTYHAGYKGITWSKRLSKKNDHHTFYPIYDWSYTDVWKFIHDNNHEYCRLYDEFYRYGLPVKEMRISNVHHETAIRSLKYMQEIEPVTWVRVADRIEGANTIKHIDKASYTCPTELPAAFDSWEDYALYLNENLVQEEKNKESVRKLVAKDKELYGVGLIAKDFWKTIINTILSSDWDFTKYQNWHMSYDVDTYRRVKLKKPFVPMLKSMKYLTVAEKEMVIEYFQKRTRDVKSSDKTIGGGNSIGGDAGLEGKDIVCAGTAG